MQHVDERWPSESDVERRARSRSQGGLSIRKLRLEAIASITLYSKEPEQSHGATSTVPVEE